MNDPFDLRRFVVAQDPVIDRVLAELAAGRKQSHWMWFVFPQIRGLGHSDMARTYAIASLTEAAAYLRHATLSARLERCTSLVLAAQGRSAEAIFGAVDARKFQSSMSLFARTAGASPLFTQALQTYYEGREDEATLARL